MTSRNTEAESHNTTDLNNLDSFVMACYNDTNKSYKLCDLGGDLVCGDLFKDTYKCCFQNCSLQGVLYREPIGELCEKSLITSLSPVTTTPTIITITTSSVTETMTFSSEKLNLYHDLAIGLPFASFSLGVFLVFVAKKVISKS